MFRFEQGTGLSREIDANRKANQVMADRLRALDGVAPRTAETRRPDAGYFNRPLPGFRDREIQGQSM